jgi:hypothetical protein
MAEIENRTSVGEDGVEEDADSAEPALDILFSRLDVLGVEDGFYFLV